MCKNASKKTTVDARGARSWRTLCHFGQGHQPCARCMAVGDDAGWPDQEQCGRARCGNFLPLHGFFRTAGLVSATLRGRMPALSSGTTASLGGRQCSPRLLVRLVRRSRSSTAGGTGCSSRYARTVGDQIRRGVPQRIRGVRPLPRLRRRAAFAEASREQPPATPVTTRRDARYRGVPPVRRRGAFAGAAQFHAAPRSADSASPTVGAARATTTASRSPRPSGRRLQRGMGPGHRDRRQALRHEAGYGRSTTRVAKRRP